MTERVDLCILGAPIDINGGCTGVPKAVERFSIMSGRLEYFDAHSAFVLLRNCLRCHVYFLSLEALRVTDFTQN